MPVMSVSEATDLVPPGARIGLGGLQGNYPMTMVRALARRRGVAFEFVAGPVVGMAAELLVAAGLVTRIAAPYMGAESVIPVAPAFRSAVEQGAVNVWECDEGILLMALRAAGQQLPFVPWQGGVGTSIPQLNPELPEVRDQSSGKVLIHVPALPLDVALVRALEADEFGNVRYHRHSYFADPAFARAAKTVIVEVERLVSHEMIIAEPERTILHRVDAVVVAPFGGHPFRVAGVQSQDDEWLREWSAGIRTAVAGAVPVHHAAVVRRELEVADEAAYLDLVGPDRIASLRL